MRVYKNIYSWIQIKKEKKKWNIFDWKKKKKKDIKRWVSEGSTNFEIIFILIFFTKQSKLISYLSLLPISSLPKLVITTSSHFRNWINEINNKTASTGCFCVNIQNGHGFMAEREYWTDGRVSKHTRRKNKKCICFNFYKINHQFENIIL